ncbi:P22 coat protein - protein 5 domain protein [bacterium]|nr:P22 coat protein - protein 5 domain protein [bacterium]
MTESSFTQNYSAFIPQLWSQKLNNMLEKNCVMMQCVNKNWEGEIQNQGDTVKIITPADVTVSTLTDSSISYSALSPSSLELKIDQRKFFAFKIDDVAKAQANGDIMEAHLNSAKRAIEEVQDSYLLGMHTNVVSANTVGTEASPISLSASTIYSNFVKLALALKNSDAVYAGVRPWVVINPTVESYLLQSTEFIGAHNVADETLREGSIGRIAGMDVLVSTNLTAVDGKYYVLAGTNDAITFASQLAKIESLRDKDSFSDLVRGLYLYGAKTVQPKALAKMIISAS